MKDINEGKQVYTFLEKKLAHFKQYLSLTEKMEKASKNEERNKDLGRLISRRQSCINKIDKIDMSIRKAIKRNSAGRFRIPNHYKEKISGCLSQLRDIMTTIDFKDRALMVRVKDEDEAIKAELLRMRNVRRASRGYRGSSGYPSRFLDTRK